MEPCACAARGGTAIDAAMMAMNKALKTLITRDYGLNSSPVKSRFGER